MYVKHEAAKRRRLSSSDEYRDRLSSLTDDILIDILSRLPTKSAIVTGLLSHRWHNLWTNLTSIHISGREFKSTFEQFKTVDNIIMQSKSPFIHVFRVDWLANLSTWQSFMDFWIRQLRLHNLRELNFTWRQFYGTLNLPRFIFQIPSLVSLKLGSLGRWKLSDEGGPLNIPNLKTLSLSFTSSNDDWLEKLLEACPSLEELYLKCVMYGKYIKCLNQNLRRLSIETTSQKALKRVEMETYHHTNRKLTSYVLELLEYLLREAPNLEHFVVRVIDDPEEETESITRKQKRESVFCQLLNRCLMIPTGCEFKFIGKFVKMSRISWC